MTRLINILLPDSAGNRRFDISLLLSRLLFGLLFMMHGLTKINDFGQMALAFPDPLGVGSEISLILAIFGEVFCSVLLIFGLLTRLALIPMIFTMCIAFFCDSCRRPVFSKRAVFYLFDNIYHNMGIRCRKIFVGLYDKGQTDKIFKPK